MRELAKPRPGDPPVVAGESATCGLAGILAAAERAEARSALALGPTSRVLVFGTEGDTDEQLYRDLVGRTAEEVLAA
jgi:diaminopropionate ammonia-lyase